jgi:hypothetical protein
MRLRIFQHRWSVHQVHSRSPNGVELGGPDFTLSIFGWLRRLGYLWRSIIAVSLSPQSPDASPCLDFVMLASDICGGTLWRTFQGPEVVAAIGGLGRALINAPHPL